MPTDCTRSCDRRKAAKILDFDVKQMTSTDWVRARLERDLEPAIEAEPTQKCRQGFEACQGYDIV
jgi:hypothetical protein